MTENRHVTKRPDGKWQVIGEKAQRASGVFDTQAAAIERAKEIATRTGGEVVIHRPNSLIRDKDSYGNDPCPPKDKKH